MSLLAKQRPSPDPVATVATDIPSFMRTKLVERKAILSDLDGCLVSGSTVLPGALELAQFAGARLWVVSNNSSDTAETLSAKLAQVGLPIAAEQIFLAGETAVRKLAAERPGIRAAVFASVPLTALASKLGLKICRADRNDLPEVALLTRDLTFSMLDLERLMRIVDRGVRVVLANPDPIHPAADGTPVPETGALFAALKSGFPHLEAETMGKPSPLLVDLALRKAGVGADDAVFLGDTDATDGEAARAAGVPFVLLRRPARRHSGEAVQC